MSTAEQNITTCRASAIAERCKCAVFIAFAAVLLGVAVVGLTPGNAYAEPDTNGLSGNPEHAAQYWGQQKYDDCMLMAVADVVGQLTGKKPSEEEIISVAESTPGGITGEPIYKRGGGGADDREEPFLFAHYGIHAVFTDDESASTTHVPTGLTALAHDLDAGRDVTAAVNSQLIWGEEGNHRDTNHIVVVTGVDRDASTVHLNDSGSDEGANE